MVLQLHVRGDAYAYRSEVDGTLKTNTFNLIAASDIPKHERRFTGFDDKIVAMYARGMTMREIQGFLQESYAVQVSPEFISSVGARGAPSSPRWWQPGAVRGTG